jgi:hypothetical protein
MKPITLFTALIVFLIAGCKKEIKTGNTEPIQSVNAPVPCAVQRWDIANTYPSHAVGLVYNNKIYVPSYDAQTMKIYDGTSWTTIASSVPLPTEALHGNNEDIVLFVLGAKGYILRPWSPASDNETDYGFWEYNFLTNAWRKKADFPGPRRDLPAYFSIGTKGYLVSGGTMVNPRFDNWEYNQATNAWTQRASLPLFARSGATGFSIGTKGYIVGGRALFSDTPLYMQELKEYDPATNSWATKSLFPGIGRESPSVFVIADKAYVSGGNPGSANPPKDMYRYTPSSNSWTRMLDVPYDYYNFFGFTLNSKGYIVISIDGSNALLKYSPEYCSPVLPQVTTSGL